MLTTQSRAMRRRPRRRCVIGAAGGSVVGLAPPPMIICGMSSDDVGVGPQLYCHVRHGRERDREESEEQQQGGSDGPCRGGANHRSEAIMGDVPIVPLNEPPPPASSSPRWHLEKNETRVIGTVGGGGGGQARGLEEPRNFQELSVGPVHFS